MEEAKINAANKKYKTSCHEHVQSRTNMSEGVTEGNK
jgi:hypothetical protein